MRVGARKTERERERQEEQWVQRERERERGRGEPKFGSPCPPFSRSNLQSDTPSQARI